MFPVGKYILLKHGKPGKLGKQYYNNASWNKNRQRTNSARLSAKNKNMKFQPNITASNKKGEYTGLKNLNRLRQGLDSAWNLKMEW